MLFTERHIHGIQHNVSGSSVLFVHQTATAVFGKPKMCYPYDTAIFVNGRKNDNRLTEDV